MYNLFLEKTMKLQVKKTFQFQGSRRFEEDERTCFVVEAIHLNNSQSSITKKNQSEFANVNPGCDCRCSILYCFSGADGIKPNKIILLWSLMAGKINTVWIYLMTIKSKLLRVFPRELVYPFPSTA